MSHFTVIVIGDDIDGQMAKYDENREVEPRWESWEQGDHYNSVKNFIEWCEKNGNFVEAAELDRRTEYVTAGTVWANPQADYTPSEGLLRLLKEWHGDCDFRYKDGKWQNTTTYNPDSKWDWFSIGGRWLGFFRLKEMKDNPQDGIGHPGAFGNSVDPEQLSWAADTALKGEIDFEAMAANSILAAEERYDEYEALEEDERKSRATLMFWPKGESTRAEYIKDYMKPWIPWAIVKDGVWYQKGDMGWWGISSNEDDDWPTIAQRMYDETPDDVRLTMLDCHI